VNRYEGWAGRRAQELNGMSESSAAIERDGHGQVLVTPGQSLGPEEGRTAGNGLVVTERGMIVTSAGFLIQNGNSLTVEPHYTRYTPRPADLIIGVIESVRNNLWFVDILGPFNALLPMSLGPAKADFGGTRQIIDVGETILCRIQEVEETHACVVTMKGLGLRKIQSGIIESIPPHLVGKMLTASRIKNLKSSTDCRIIVAENGRIWVEGPTQGQRIARTFFEAVRDGADESELDTLVAGFLDGGAE
jgi:exosome complex component RRP4